MLVNNKEKLNNYKNKYKNYDRVGGGKLNRIEQSKGRSGSRNDRKLKKYSDKFNKMFEFYLKVYRTGLITFCGDKFQVDFDINSGDGRFSFREYDNGRFKHRNPVSKHPNILYGIIVGKKGWGLWVKQWTEGIVECSFTKEEIIQEFIDRDIEIPEPLMVEWDKLIQKMKVHKYDKMLKDLNS